MLTRLKHSARTFGCTKQLNLLVVLDWVKIFPLLVSWVGLGQSADGLSWIGSHKMYPRTTLASMRAVPRFQRSQTQRLVSGA